MHTHMKHTQTLPYSSIALHSKEMSCDNTAYYTYNASKSFTRTVKSNWGEITFTPGPSRPHHIPQETPKEGSTMPDLQLPEAFFFLGILPQSVWSHWVSQRHNSLISVRVTLKFLGNLDISLLCASDWKKKVYPHLLFSLLCSNKYPPSEHSPDPPLTRRKTWCTCGGNENTLNLEPCS